MVPRPFRHFASDELEGIDRFFAKTFAGDYQRQLLDEFNRLLPKHPPWSVN